MVDSDAAGRAIAAVLRDGGVDDAAIFALRDRSEHGLTIEDFVEAETYRSAVNEELRRSGHGDHEFARGELPAVGGAAHVEAWAADRAIGNPNKVRVGRSRRSSSGASDA